VDIGPGLVRGDVGGVVENDGVEVLAAELRFGVLPSRTIFEGKADGDTPPLDAADRGGDIHGRQHADGPAVSVLCQFVPASSSRTIIADRRGEDGGVRGAESPLRGRRHFGGADHVNRVYSRRRGEFDGTADERDAMPFAGGGGGDGIAQPPAGAVGEEADRIKILAGRTGGDNDVEGSLPAALPGPAQRPQAEAWRDRIVR